MKLHFRKWISSNWPILFLVVFEIVLAAKNIVPGTWLTGWDSTQPELNFKLNLMRSLSSVWQEYRGLGLPDGMAHAANIVHLFYVWMLSLVVPDNLIRYVFVFLSHLVGGTGVYKLLQHLLKKGNSLALAGASLYLLNPITIQMFYQPLELFIIHFAGLPWLVLTLMKYLEAGGKRNLIWLAVVLVALVSQNHVPTIFIVTMMVVGLILLASLVASKGKSFKKILAVVGLVLGVNSFWLLPYMMTSVSNSQVIPQAKMNLLSNPEVILRNAEYGDLHSVVMMQGFSLSYEDWHLDGPTGLQMPQWGDWWDIQSVVLIMWIVFGLAIIGIMKSVWKREWKIFAIGLVWVVALFNLGVRIPVIDLVMTWVYANVPLYGAVFRFAFTKFSIVYALTSTILMIYVLDGLVRKWGKTVTGMVVIGACLWIGCPVFSGNFLYKELRVNLPSEYQKLFKYFDNAEVGRVARLPAFDLWGWESNSWGYRGSGIAWQGVRSPMLLRSFDPWSPYNETFYNEFSTTLYGENIDKVAKVLNKYDVRYVLLDESVIAPGQGKEILRIEETKKIAKELGWQQKFQEGFLSVWEIPSTPVLQYSSTPVSSFISAPSEYSFVEGDTSKVREDVVFDQIGTYVNVDWKTGKLENRNTNIIYPFANLMREEVKGVEYGEDAINLIINYKFSNSQILIPGWKVGDIVRIQYKDGVPIPAYYVSGQEGPKFLGKEKPEEGKDIIYAKVSEGKEWSEYLKDQRFELQDSNLKIEVPTLPRIYDFGTLGQGKLGNCDVLKRGVAEKLGTIYIADSRGAACDYIEMTEIDPRMSYLMRFQGNNIEGRSLKYFLYNTGSMRNDMEYLLGKNKYDQTFSLLSWQRDGYYTLNIETRSFGQRAENLVQPIEVRWFPLTQIAGAKIILNQKLSNSPVGNELQIKSVKKNGTWLYTVKVEGSGLLKLSQGYDDGWVSPGLTHVKVDGWANGWIIPESGEATIFYWPQLLEYLGFVILGTTIVIVIFRKK